MFVCHFCHQASKKPFTNELSQNTILQLSILTYGIRAWGNASFSALHRTAILKILAIRTIPRSNYNSHTEPLFKSSGILNVKDL